jgi:hypothetical protein
MGIVRFTVAVALACCGAGQAQAQDFDELVDEGDLYCVLAKIPSDDAYVMVGEAYGSPNTPADKRAKAVAIIEEAGKSCGAENVWSATQRSEAMKFLGHTAAAQYFSEALLRKGGTIVMLDGVDEVHDNYGTSLSRFFEDGWKGDASFTGMLKTSLRKAGLPDDAGMLMTAMEILAAKAYANSHLELFAIETEEVLNQ